MNIAIEILTFLNGVALTIFTGFLVRATNLLDNETKLTREQNIKPQISIIFYGGVSYDEEGQIIFCRIENTGRGDAKNVEIKCLSDNVYKNEKNNCDIFSKLSRSYKYFAVNQAYTYKIGKYEELNKEQLKFQISFDNLNGGMRENYEIEIDISQLEYSRLEKNNIEIILNKMNKSINSVIENNPLGGIRTITYTQDNLENIKLKNENDVLKLVNKD